MRAEVMARNRANARRSHFVLIACAIRAPQGAASMVAGTISAKPISET